jgi:hypothetical protein
MLQSIAAAGKIFGKSTRRREKRLDKAVYGVIEALERRVLMSTSIVVTTDGDGAYTAPTGSPGSYSALTLRDAVSFASGLSGSTTISFASDVVGQTITLGSTIVLTGASGIYIEGDVTSGTPKEPEVTISGDSTVTVFQVNSGVTATFYGLNVTDGYTSGNGGDIEDDGCLTANYCNVSRGTASQGGGLYTNGGTQLMAYHCEFYSNYATNQGGGLDLGGATAILGDDTVGGTAADDGNIATGNGGGIIDAGGSTLYITGG